MTYTPKTLLILGATSDMGNAIAAYYAQRGSALILAGRNVDEMQLGAQDLRVRYNAKAELLRFDVLDAESHLSLFKDLREIPEMVVCCVGFMGTPATLNHEPEMADVVMRTNYNGPALALNAIANEMEKRGSGVIVGISSVAGDRGRASNVFYGSAKAGFTAFLSGLRNRMAKKGVHVVTCKPGFVDTRMTRDMNLPGLLTAQPQEVAKAIALAVEKKKNIIYVRSVWRMIMLIIIHLPECIFKRLSL